MGHAFFCEVDPFCRSVLRRHWPGIPIYEDIRELRGADLPPVDVLCGGFPCQDVSLAAAGKRKGITGKRSGLWHEYARLIEEIRPRSGMMRSGKCFPRPRSAPRNAALMPYLGLEYVLIVPEKWNEPQMCRICGFFFDKTVSPNNDGNKIFNLMRSNYASCNKTSQATVRQTHGIRSQADSQEIRKMGPEGSLYRLNKQAKTRKRNAS